METKEIGKIKDVSFGFGGYQDCMLGISFGLGSDKNGWSTCYYKGFWNSSIEVNERSEWTEEDRRKQHADTMEYIDSILTDAKVRDINKLVGIPVEVTFKSNSIKSFRILTEAI